MRPRGDAGHRPIGETLDDSETRSIGLERLENKAQLERRSLTRRAPGVEHRAVRRIEEDDAPRKGGRGGLRFTSIGPTHGSLGSEIVSGGGTPRVARFASDDPGPPARAASPGSAGSPDSRPW